MTLEDLGARLVNKYSCEIFIQFYPVHSGRPGFLSSITVRPISALPAIDLTIVLPSASHHILGSCLCFRPGIDRGQEYQPVGGFFDDVEGALQERNLEKDPACVSLT
jgi:hypothetical protein